MCISGPYSSFSGCAVDSPTDPPPLLGRKPERTPAASEPKVPSAVFFKPALITAAAKPVPAGGKPAPSTAAPVTPRPAPTTVATPEPASVAPAEPRATLSASQSITLLLVRANNLPQSPLSLKSTSPPLPIHPQSCVSTLTNQGAAALTFASDRGLLAAGRAGELLDHLRFAAEELAYSHLRVRDGTIVACHKARAPRAARHPGTRHPRTLSRPPPWNPSARAPPAHRRSAPPRSPLRTSSSTTLLCL